MNAQHPSQSDTEPTVDRTTTRTPPPPSSDHTDSRRAIDRAPRTFSHRRAGRLENLIDEWNAAFASGTPRNS
ncbi:hypothetical protein [Natrinema longum]|uniref:Uncharacterized protein n=1 Tax=Natrinema longum TaxID=370324 RepID=A0A8A2UA90_9EURY|nr:hypothetical protein [Natrinema longum]MBZ6493539.1 hypothetical protein [Natrinema longum]QSW85115.1 hypothetical protein J0X27_16980 [Natrinema longum]